MLISEETMQPFHVAKPWYIISSYIIKGVPWPVEETAVSLTMSP